MNFNKKRNTIAGAKQRCELNEQINRAQMTQTFTSFASQFENQNRGSAESFKKSPRAGAGDLGPNYK